MSQSERMERLLRRIAIVCRPVEDYGPANDEMISVRASDLYYLMQAAEAVTAGRTDHRTKTTRRITAP